MTNHPKLIHYVVIISQHNLPNLLSILSQDKKPERVFLIATQSFKEQAQKFTKRLKLLVPSIKIESIPTDNIDGEDMAKMLPWNQNVLHSYYQRYPDVQWILNVTGGTKIMVLALVNALVWSEIHYKAMHVNQVQRWNHKQQLLPALEVPDIKVMDTLKLYVDATESPYNQSSVRLNIAQKIWDYSNGVEFNPHLTLVEQLNHIWSDKSLSNQYKIVSGQVEIPWRVFPGSASIMKTWCEQLQKTFPDVPVSITEKALLIPHPPNKALKKWKKWLEGLWFETLIYHWLIQRTHLTKEKIATNVRISGVNRELDFVVLDSKNNLCLLEAKVAPPDGGEKLNTIIRQITSIDMIGTPKRVLFISPYFRKRIINTDTEKDFFTNCKENNIFVVENPDDLSIHFNFEETR